MFFFANWNTYTRICSAFFKKKTVSIFSSTNKPVLIGVLKSSVAASWITMAET